MQNLLSQTGIEKVNASLNNIRAPFFERRQVGLSSKEKKKTVLDLFLASSNQQRPQRHKSNKLNFNKLSELNSSLANVSTTHAEFNRGIHTSGATRNGAQLYSTQLGGTHQGIGS